MGGPVTIEGRRRHPETAKAVRDAARFFPTAWIDAAGPVKAGEPELPMMERAVTEDEARDWPRNSNGVPVLVEQPTGRSTRQRAVYTARPGGGYTERVDVLVDTARHPGGSGWTADSTDGGPSWSRPLPQPSTTAGYVGDLDGQEQPRTDAVHQLAHVVEARVPAVREASATAPQAGSTEYGSDTEQPHRQAPVAGHSPQREGLATGMVTAFGPARRDPARDDIEGLLSWILGILLVVGLV